MGWPHHTTPCIPPKPRQNSPNSRKTTMHVFIQVSAILTETLSCCVVSIWNVYRNPLHSFLWCNKGFVGLPTRVYFSPCIYKHSIREHGVPLLSRTTRSLSELATDIFSIARIYRLTSYNIIAYRHSPLIIYSLKKWSSSFIVQQSLEI